MNQKDISILIDIICSDEIEFQQDNTHLILKFPTPQIKAKASRVYRREYARGIQSGMSTEDALLEEYIGNGILPASIQIEIDGLKKDIHEIKRGLISLIFQREKLERARSMLRSAEKALTERLETKQAALSSAAETHSLMCKQRYLISQITYLPNGKLFWKNQKDFDDYTNINLINSLCTYFFQNSRLSHSVMRSVSRSDVWKPIWSTAKGSFDIFGKSILELSENQTELLYWSQVYDNVNGAYERPPTEIIEDDDLLDSWFIQQSEKIEARTNKGLGENVLSGANKGSRKGGRQECFVVADQEGAKAVYKLNDVSSRIKVKAKQKIVANEGQVKEQHMADSQQEMRQIAAQQYKKNIGNKG